MMFKLLDNVSGSNTGDAVQLVEAGVDRVWSVHVSGVTSGGGSVTVEAAPTATGPWAPLLLADGTSALSQDGLWPSDLSRLWFVRATSSGVSGATVGIK